MVWGRVFSAFLGAYHASDWIASRRQLNFENLSFIENLQINFPRGAAFHSAQTKMQSFVKQSAFVAQLETFLILASRPWVQIS